MADDFAYDVFLSHSSKDKAAVTPYVTPQRRKVTLRKGKVIRQTPFEISMKADEISMGA